MTIDRQCNVCTMATSSDISRLLSYLRHYDDHPLMEILTKSQLARRALHATRNEFYLHPELLDACWKLEREFTSALVDENSAARHVVTNIMYMLDKLEPARKARHAAKDDLDKADRILALAHNKSKEEFDTAYDARTKAANKLYEAKLTETSEQIKVDNANREEAQIRAKFREEFAANISERMKIEAACIEEAKLRAEFREKAKLRAEFLEKAVTECEPEIAEHPVHVESNTTTRAEA